MTSTTIATWFVADDAASATFFPQVGARSDCPQAQAAYWRCTVCFYASSLAHNPDRRHVFYTNTRVPVVDDIDLDALLRDWGVEIAGLPITWKLPQGEVGSWGNQFYVFDVLEHFAAEGATDRLILLDSDCVWTAPAGSIERTIDIEGMPTYLLDETEHPAGEPINGLSREGMAAFLAAHGGAQARSIPYYGGEILAINAATAPAILGHARTWWPEIVAGADNAPREEAHLLSICAAREGIAGGGLNPFIRRMWTTFRVNNVSRADYDLDIWHLPAEKRTGFADLFRDIVAHRGDPRRDAAAMGLGGQNLSRRMGVPRRSPVKFVRDAGAKLKEKLKA